MGGAGCRARSSADSRCDGDSAQQTQGERRTNTPGHLRGSFVMIRVATTVSVVAEYFRLEPQDARPAAPRVTRQTGLETRVREKRLAIPAVFRRNLRQKQPLLRPRSMISPSRPTTISAVSVTTCGGVRTEISSVTAASSYACSGLNR